MTTVEGRTFQGLFDEDGSRAVIEDREFVRCKFQSCFFVPGRSSRERAHVRGVRLVDCTARACSVGSIVIQDCSIDGLETADLLQVGAIACRRLVLRGRLGRVRISPHIMGPDEPSAEAELAEANRAFYASVDWALDVREAEARELEIKGIPAHLIRRDAETQVLVRREKVADGAWKKLALRNTWWPESIARLLESDEAACVLIAPKRHAQFKALLKGLQVLRKAGIAEPE